MADICVFIAKFANLNNDNRFLCIGIDQDFFQMPEIKKNLKKANFWVRRRSHIPVILIGTLVVLLLYFNEDTSVTLNMQYDREINRLNECIREARDSAAYYRARRMAIEAGEAPLEYMAREQYHMQRPSEDVFLIK